MSEPAANLEALYRDLGPGLLAYLQRTCRSTHAAEDLLHETFCQAARHPERLARATSPRAWLFAIARHVVLTALRRRRVMAPLPDALPAQTPEADPRHERVRAAIGELPAALRETLELRVRDDLSYEEIAAVLGIPLGTVRSRLHNALQRLRACVTDSDE